jgi:hypothetical protein
MLALTLVFLVTGCAVSWSRVLEPAPTAQPETLDYRQLFQIWTPRGVGAFEMWFSVVLTHDSVSGVKVGPGRFPHEHNEYPRRTLPLAAVDSIRAGTPTVWAGFWGLALLAGIIALLDITHAS